MPARTVLPRMEIRKRLQMIFPEGTPHRGYCTRELAASIVFTALYVGAVEGSGIYIAPKYVYRMTDEQAGRMDIQSRLGYRTNVMKAGFEAPGRRWYRDNTREPIRDETLRDGLIPVGAVIEKAGIPTTSSKPRYALTVAFAALFDPILKGDVLDATVSAWQAKALSKGALARISFPNGETRRKTVGPSSEITKAVIEVFALRFLDKPAVLYVSESGNKVVARDDALARSIGLEIDAAKNLPDTILVDLGPEHPLLIFIEAVATDGPMNERRKRAFEELATEAGYPLDHVAFVTAYLDRSGTAFKKTVDALAWGSYAWFLSEPEGLIELSQSRPNLR
jgi:BsuBI/PstI restriction endonuclease domain/BsuBI/PstI restriction endonuclease HTH domain